jgi:Rab-3A-interacting protein
MQCDFLTICAYFQFDPVAHKEFLEWKQDSPKVDKTNPFISRVYREDIDLCLNFSNAEMGTRVYHAIEADTVFIEAVTEKSKSAFPKYARFISAKSCPDIFYLLLYF